MTRGTIAAALDFVRAMPARTWLIVIFACWANASPIAQRLELPATVPGPSRVALTVDKPSFFLGENVLVHYCLENTGTQPITIDVGGDSRGASRSRRFTVVVTDAHGSALPDPDPGGFTLGGIGTSPTIVPGEQWCQSLPLMRYARIDGPGTYAVRVTHDLGWPKGQAPEGRASVTLKMPTPAEAEGVLRTMDGMGHERPVMGRRSGPWVDFTMLRYGVYLRPLLRRARAGQAEATTGISVIPTFEATGALVALAADRNASIARPAARALAMRLPDPQLAGALPRRSPFGDDLVSPRTYLRSASWRPAFAPKVRTIARRFLASPDKQDVVEGAFFLEAVGEAGDASTLSAALSRAIDMTPTLSLEKGIYPRPRGALAELMRAADVLLARGYAPPAPHDQTGDVALWLATIGRGARPLGWQDVMARALAHRIPWVRELALDKMPDVVPESLVAAVGANLAVSDVDVQIAGCRLVERGKLGVFRAAVKAIAETAREYWLLNASQNALDILGGRIDVLEIAARRLVDSDVTRQMFGTLSGVLDATGLGGGEIRQDQARALSDRWLAFIAAHRVELEAGHRLSLDRTDIPIDLVPPGWTFHRDGKPDWPPRH
jgi:hypothetical protein